MKIQLFYHRLIKRAFIVLLFCSMYNPASAQESYKALNLGVGLGYYRYAAYPMPVLHANYEFDVARNFTLAPFVTLYSYRDDYYWGNAQNPPRYYRYRQTVVPIGVKGTYYFDELFRANSDWDFYVAGSLGFNIVSTRWEDGYYGDRRVYRNYNGTSPIYADLHVGAEYHLNDKIGLFLDLSTGVSTFGIGIH
jgi:hypothetical protein